MLIYRHLSSSTKKYPLWLWGNIFCHPDQKYWILYSLPCLYSYFAINLSWIKSALSINRAPPVRSQQRCSVLLASRACQRKRAQSIALSGNYNFAFIVFSIFIASRPLGRSILLTHHTPAGLRERDLVRDHTKYLLPPSRERCIDGEGKAKNRCLNHRCYLEILCWSSRTEKTPLAYTNHCLFSRVIWLGRATSKAKRSLPFRSSLQHLGFSSQKEKPFRRINRRTWSLARFSVLFVTWLIVPRRLRQGGKEEERMLYLTLPIIPTLEQFSQGFSPSRLLQQ